VVVALTGKKAFYGVFFKLYSFLITLLRKSSKQLKIASTMHDKKLLYRTSLAPPPLLSNNAPKCELHWPEKLGKN
jgi:hypothetical protein